MVAQLMVRSGEDWSPLVAQGLSFCILDRQAVSATSILAL
jgi:hypothetical protein